MRLFPCQFNIQRCYSVGEKWFKTIIEAFNVTLKRLLIELPLTSLQFLVLDLEPLMHHSFPQEEWNQVLDGVLTGSSTISLN